MKKIVSLGLMVVFIAALVAAPHQVRAKDEDLKKKCKESDLIWLAGYMTLKAGGCHELEIPEDRRELFTKFILVAATTGEGGALYRKGYENLYMLGCNAKGARWGIDFSADQEFTLETKTPSKEELKFFCEKVQKARIGALEIWRENKDGTIKTTLVDLQPAGKE